MSSFRSRPLCLFKEFKDVSTSNKKILFIFKGFTKFNLVARFPNMLGILNFSLKAGLKSCEIPVNKLCLSTLRILRQKNLIYGFTYTSPRKFNRLFPRVKIFLKMADYRSSSIRYIRATKQTLSNFTILGTKTYKQENANKKLLITKPEGLNIMTLTSLNKGSKLKKGKILAEFS